MNAFSLMCRLAGALAHSSREDPAIPQASEFKSQRKLDLPLVILQLMCDRACAPVRRFRERGVVSWISGEYTGVQTSAAEVWMVQDVEELRSEFQHATLSQEP